MFTPMNSFSKCLVTADISSHQPWASVGNKNITRAFGKFRQWENNMGGRKD